MSPTWPLSHAAQWAAALDQSQSSASLNQSGLNRVTLNVSHRTHAVLLAHHRDPTNHLDFMNCP